MTLYYEFTQLAKQGYSGTFEDFLRALEYQNNLDKIEQTNNEQSIDSFISLVEDHTKNLVKSYADCQGPMNEIIVKQISQVIFITLKRLNLSSEQYKELVKITNTLT